MQRFVDYLSHVWVHVLRPPIWPAGVRWRLMNLLPGCRIEPCTIGPYPVVERGNITIERGVGVSVNVGFYGLGGVTLEEGVMVGPDCTFLSSGHELGPAQRRAGLLVDAPIRVGRGSWLGAGVMVLPGVTIAPGCVIAAGSVVRSSTKPDGLYVGTPARRLRDLPPGASTGGAPLDEESAQPVLD